jgi:hypothetical protein
MMLQELEPHGYIRELETRGLSQGSNLSVLVLRAMWHIRDGQLHFQGMGIQRLWGGRVMELLRELRGCTHGLDPGGASKGTNSWVPALQVLHSKVAQFHFPRTEAQRLWVDTKTTTKLGLFGCSHASVVCGLNKEASSLAQVQQVWQHKAIQFLYRQMEIWPLWVDHLMQPVPAQCGCFRVSEGFGLNKEIRLLELKPWAVSPSKEYQFRSLLMGRLQSLAELVTMLIQGRPGFYT